ncbi:MAG: molybdenum ABC transporter substrate-binding protein [Coriobacteriia bacterium]|nr:MAG: molybdenum ABC transporter substrate-binding protein [Coriobacteriia bacterium]
MRKSKLAKVLTCGVVAAGLIATLGLTACGGSNASSSASSNVELQVFAANSLSKAMDEAQELYTQQTGVTFADTQYKASGELNEMLKAGSYADLEITASKGTMDTAVQEGYVDESTRTDMFTNELVIVAKEDSALQDVTLQQIASGDLTVCVGDDSVPAGNYAAQALSTVGAYQPPAADASKSGKDISGKGGRYVGITPILQTSVGNVCKQAENGDVDVAIVYSSDVYRFGGVKVVGIIPDDTHKAIVYPGAVCKDSKNAQAANDFMQWCITDPDAQKIFQKWGFDLS